MIKIKTGRSGRSLIIQLLWVGFFSGAIQGVLIMQVWASAFFKFDSLSPTKRLSKEVKIVSSTFLYFLRDEKVL
jgi:hypothetical protein